jgi:hypothetical protein
MMDRVSESLYDEGHAPVSLHSTLLISLGLTKALEEKVMQTMPRI